MKIEVLENDKNERIDIFLSKKLCVSRNKIKNLIDLEKIKLNGKNFSPSYKIKTDDIIEYDETIEIEPEIKPENIPLDIIYEDDDLIVLNKQKGLICHPTSHNFNNTLVNALLFHTKNLSNIEKNRPGIVHRLDCDTSGLMLIAKNNESHIKLQTDIKTKKTIRKYLAICHGIINENEGIIDKPLIHSLGKTVKMQVSDTGLNSVTKFKVIERFNQATYLEIELLTGRTHQIRCHFSSINHPILGDNLYGSKGFKTGALKGLKTQGQVLESYYLLFTHPKTGEIMEFEIRDEKHHPDLIKTLNFLRSIN